MATTNPEKQRHAETIIRNHVLWSMGASFIPVILADILAVSALQLDMIRQLCKVYEVDFKETQGKAVVSALTSSSLAKVAAKGIIKLLPGIGSLIGGVTVSVFAGASTYALGQVFCRHFESGGTILDLDPERFKKMYKDQFEKGKDIVKEWKTKSGPEEQQPGPAFSFPQAEKAKDDVISRLKELAELKEAGAITEEEFEILKKRLIS